MRKLLTTSALLIVAAGYVYLQTPVPSTDIPAFMPTGALLYLHASDFGRLLREWDTSKVKADWLASDNYEVFSRSNLFAKLGAVYDEYSAAAAFAPGLKGIQELAGTESALAMYGIREVEFLYVTRVGEAKLARTELWGMRSKFEQRQSGGIPFYLRVDPASKRTVAFAFAKGYLLMATRDDLVARALTLMGGKDASLASEAWYREAVASAGKPGELRLVMNLESIVKNVGFRSYWVQRNSSDLKQYWTGIADITRSAGAYTESRVFLRSAEMPAAPPQNGALSPLIALVPLDVDSYRATGKSSASDAAALIVQKLIAPLPEKSEERRYAPAAVTSNSAGTEADLETRTDEPPVQRDAGIDQSIARLAQSLGNTPIDGILLMQSAVPAGRLFVRTPSAMVLMSSAEWDSTTISTALTEAVGPLWTTSALGARWVTAKAGTHDVQQLDGLGKLMFAVRGKLLFIGSDAGLLGAALDRINVQAPAEMAGNYAAGFRHTHARTNYMRVMKALDFGSQAPGREPAFFSENLGSLSSVLSDVSEVDVIRTDAGVKMMQTVTYHLRP